MTAFLCIGDQQIEYARWGPDDGPQIVLLHEGLGSVGLWRSFPAELSARTGRGVIAYSRAGYGQSSPVTLPRPLDYMTREGDTLRRLFDVLGLTRVTLLGHSDGATIAAIYAGHQHDPRVEGLVLMAPHFFAEDCTLAAIRDARVAYEDGGLKARLTRHHRHVDVAFYGWCDAWLDPGFKTWDVSEVIENWRVPVLAIQGREDPYGTIAQVEMIRDRAQVTVQIQMIDDCAHAPHAEAPAETLATVTRFVRQIAR